MPVFLTDFKAGLTQIVSPYHHSMRLERIHRRGLDESLQQFARRIGGSDANPEKYRHSWALQGLRFLGAVPLTEPWEATVVRIGDGARIAPGIRVPTKSV